MGNLAAIMAKTAKRPLLRFFFKEWRKFRGLTQQDLADQLGLTKATVSRIETGDIDYGRRFLEGAADVLGTTPGRLLSGPPTEADAYPLPEQRRRAR